MRRHVISRGPVTAALALAMTTLMTTGLQAQDSNRKIVTVASTVPGNGDVNPYGVAIVQASTGKLVQGHILVSNFNNSSNWQGTGTTIMDIAPKGNSRLFAWIDPQVFPDHALAAWD